MKKRCGISGDPFILSKPPTDQYIFGPGPVLMVQFFDYDI